jgi:hypothetical protein
MTNDIFLNRLRIRMHSCGMQVLRVNTFSTGRCADKLRHFVEHINYKTFYLL